MPFGMTRRTKRIVTLRIRADADDGRRRQEGRQQFLKIHAPLQDRPADRRRVERLAAGAAVHHAHDRLAAEREQQAVAVRDDDIELAQIDLQREKISQIAGRHAEAGPGLHE